MEQGEGVNGAADNAPRRRQDAVRMTLVAAAALAVWAAVIAVGRLWGLRLEAAGRNIVLYTPPLLGGYRLVPAPHLWVGMASGAAAVALVPVLARRLPWRALVVTMPVASLGWAVGLGAVDGTAGLTNGLGWDTEFAPFVSKAAGDPLAFLAGYVPDIKSYSIQIRGHPPGFMLVLGLLERVGLQGVGWASALVVVVAASAVAAVLLVVRDLAGEQVARRAAPFVAIAPAAMWMVTSMDSLFVGVTAWSVALVFFAARGAGRRWIALAVAGGALAGFALMLSYGLVLMAAVIAPTLWSRRHDDSMRRAVAVAAAAGAVVVLAFIPAGYWWLAGLVATREEYRILDVDRPYNYFLVNNLAAWAIAVGPALAVGLAWLRDRRVWLVVGGALSAGIMADLSGMSSGEVERIWLPFTIWLLPAGASLGKGSPENKLRDGSVSASQGRRSQGAGGRRSRGVAVTECDAASGVIWPLKRPSCSPAGPNRRWAPHAWLAAQVIFTLAITSRIRTLW